VSESVIEVRSLTDLSELDDARHVFDSVWPSGGNATQVQSNLMKAIVHAGGYASAAYLDGEPIGAAFGFLGAHEEAGQRAVHLHSHMAAVLDQHRDKHVGTLLKFHQRDWARERRIDTIVWTFDPLVRRNAFVNLVRLGAEVDGFEIDFYGSMDDSINTGDPTDRLFAWWRLSSARAADASLGRLQALDVDALIASGKRVNEVALPEDIVALRGSDPGRAAQWRVNVREALLTNFASGHRIIGVSTSGGYVLERKS
jgi:predicted GNAT superfamily acetyltransferase